MLKTKMFCCLVILSISFAASSQQKIKFSSFNTAGVSVGKSGSFGVVQTVNGVKYKEWFAGIGLGIDYYKNRTIPLFIDVRRDLLKENVFAFADLGYNFPQHNNPGKEISYYSTYDFSGGFYSEVGIGYKMRLMGKRSLLVTSGYSYKTLSNKVGTVNPCLIGPCPVSYNTYWYSYGTILFKAGFQL